METLNLGELSGRYTLEVKDENGEIKYSGERQNRITKNGLLSWGELNDVSKRHAFLFKERDDGSEKWNYILPVGQKPDHAISTSMIASESGGTESQVRINKVNSTTAYAEIDVTWNFRVGISGIYKAVGWGYMEPTTKTISNLPAIARRNTNFITGAAINSNLSLKMVSISPVKGLISGSPTTDTIRLNIKDTVTLKWTCRLKLPIADTQIRRFNSVNLGNGMIHNFAAKLDMSMYSDANIRNNIPGFQGLNGFQRTMVSTNGYDQSARTFGRTLADNLYTGNHADQGERIGSGPAAYTIVQNTDPESGAKLNRATATVTLDYEEANGDIGLIKLGIGWLPWLIEITPKIEKDNGRKIILNFQYSWSEAQT